MKQISITIALALSCTFANAQNIIGSHEVRANDEVKKQQVEYAAVDSTGQNMVWDLSEVVLPKWTLTADYTEQIREPSPDLFFQMIIHGLKEAQENHMVLIID